MGRDSEKTVFGDDDENVWGLINSMCDNMDMIGNRLAPDGFTRKTLEEMKEATPATNSDLPFNYELYKSFAEATEALINLASGMTWNNFSNDYTYILSEIKESNKDGMERC